MAKTDVSNLPTLRYGDKGEDVKVLQRRLKELGYFDGSIGGNFRDITDRAVRDFQKDFGLVADGIVGPITRAKMQAIGEDETYPAPIRVSPPWYQKMKEWTGRGERDSKFVAYMSGFWSKVGLPGYKTIIGSRFAWCGLGVAAALITTSLAHQKDGAGAKNWAKYGTAIEWKIDGIPQGAIVHVNSKYCGSSSNNHVSLADGDCTASHLTQSGATINLRGANQSDQVKVSTYRVSTICAVRWPSEVPKPSKIIKSINCTSGSAGNESTR